MSFASFSLNEPHLTAVKIIKKSVEATDSHHSFCEDVINSIIK